MRRSSWCRKQPATQSAARLRFRIGVSAKLIEKFIHIWSCCRSVWKYGYAQPLSYGFIQ
jgi:hypothetical protein